MGKYLGISILQKRVSKNTFGYNLDNMKKRLANWKGNSLTLASRKILTQSTGLDFYLHDADSSNSARAVRRH